MATTTYENPSDSVRKSFVVYFNGVAVPAVQATVTSKVWQFPTATITLPADKTLRRLGREDKIQVAIFYLDTDYFEEPTFCLLFEGELRGWGYRSHATGRVMQFSAQGHGAILTQLFPFFMTSLDDVASGATNFSTTGKAFAEFEGTMTAALLYRGLNVKGAIPITRPFEYVQNILMALYGKSDNYVNGSVTQYFFGRWARLTDFHNKWIPTPFFELEDLTVKEGKEVSPDGVFPIMRAVQSQVTLDTMAKVQLRIGTNGSFWDLLRQLFSLFQYEVAINPAPAYAQVDLNTGKVLGPPQYKAGPTEKGQEAVDPKKPNRLLEYVTKPIASFTIPPMCNVIYPSMLKSYGFQENYATEPTRIYVSDKSLYTLFKGGGSAIDKLLIEAQTIAYPPIVNEFMDRKKSSPNISGYNMLSWPEEFFKGPVILTHTAPQWFYVIASAYNVGHVGTPEQIARFTNNIYNAYAATEYYRERYSNKFGSVDTVFNPYVVPGYPGVVFDNLDMGMHTNMSVLGCTHTLSQDGFSTSISYSFAQSFDDFFELRAKDLAGAPDSPLSKTQKEVNDYKEQITNLESSIDPVTGDPLFSANAGEPIASTTVDNNFTPDLALRNLEDLKALKAQLALKQIGGIDSIDVAPIHPIPDVRYRLQNQHRAEQMYASLFHRTLIDPKERMGERQAAFSVTKRVKIKVGDTYVDPAKASEFLEKFDEQATFDYELSPEDKVYAESTERAMHAVARPICTLDEYINTLGDRGRRRSADLVAPNDVKQGLGAPYYVIIADYIAGPGKEPPKDSNGYYMSAVTVDTRMDWTKLLLEYRGRVFNSDAPFKA